MVVRRRRQRKQRGGVNWRSLLKRGHDYVKKNKIASKSLGALGFQKAAQIADLMGYGARRTRRTRRTRRITRDQRMRQLLGGAWYNTLWNGIKKGANAVGNFVVKHKPISKVLSFVPDGRAQIASKVASTIGLGKVKRRAPARAVRRVRRAPSRVVMRGGSSIVNPYVLIN